MKGTNLVTARVKVHINELTHIANRKQHLVREMVHAWQHANREAVTSSLPQCAETNKQTNKHKRVGQVKSLPMKHSWEGRKRVQW
jgi:hypothetical protein